MRLKWIILFAVILTACGGRVADQSPPAVPNNNGSSPIAIPTAIGNTPTHGTATKPAATPRASLRPSSSSTAKPIVRPQATSSGSLVITGIYVASCRLAPTTDKPGKIVIQISIEAAGGDGQYQYFDNAGNQWPTKFSDIPGEKGTAMIGKVKVTSGDGQSIEKEYYISPGDLTCSL